MRNISKGSSVTRVIYSKRDFPPILIGQVGKDAGLAQCLIVVTVAADITNFLVTESLKLTPHRPM